MRLTHSVVRVAVALLDRPDASHFGYELSKESGVRSGVLYPVLTRMLDEGWVTDEWEAKDERDKSRPPRRYYRITDDGIDALGALVTRAQTDARFRPIELGWQL